MKKSAPSSLSRAGPGRQYEPLPRAPEEDALWKEQVKELADVASYMDRQRVLLQAGLADSARVVSAGEGRRIYDAAKGTMSKLTELQGQHAAAGSWPSLQP